jgi:hypothetical protein
LAFKVVASTPLDVPDVSLLSTIPDDTTVGGLAGRETVCLGNDGDSTIMEGIEMPVAICSRVAALIGETLFTVNFPDWDKCSTFGEAERVSDEESNEDMIKQY